MKFLTRSLVALFLLSITAGLLVFAGGQIFWAVKEAQSDERPGRPQRERVFAVNVAVLEPVTIAPQITAYGRALSWRSTELRAVVSGALVGLSPDFRDGGSISEGQMVFEIDPAKFRSALVLAENALREAEVELSDARAAIALARTEVELAQKQLEPRRQAYERQQNLKERGVSTDADVENAALALFSAEQAVLNQQQALAQAQTRILRAEIAVDRQQTSVAEATRLLSETTVSAPFDGVVSNVTAIQGQLVSANEKLGDLIDPEALEVAFRLSNTRYGRLLDSEGNIRPLPVYIRYDLEDLPFALSGVIDRAGAVVGEGQTGRLVYARLSGAGVSILRPGDFLTVTVEESPLENVALVPASAVDSAGNMLVLGSEDRLEEVPVRILRRQADGVIIADAPFGREYVLALNPQIGKGIQVRPMRESDVAETAALPIPPAAPEMIVLDAARKAELLAFVESNQRMPAEAKARIMAQLSEPEVPRDIVARLEDRMAR